MSEPGVEAIVRPEAFVARHSSRLASGAEVLDVACGRGRHSMLLARSGCRVLALDRSPDCVASIAAAAAAEGLSIAAVEADVERMSLLPAGFDAIVNTLFLHRPLFGDFQRALRPGGILFFGTFTTDHADVLGKDRPGRRFLLEPGELRAAFPGLVVEHYDEAIADGRAMATLVARKPAGMTE